MEKSSGKKELPSWIGDDRFLGGLLLLAVVLAYLPVWRAGFIWDDHDLITANPCIVGPLGLKEIWTTGAARICPLTLTTFWVEHGLWGLWPLPYHLVNVLLHGACAVLLWRVLRSLRAPGAWLGAALWALHPVQVETVAWITELKNTQSSLFYLLSILFFVKGLKTAEDRSNDARNYGLTLLFAALAMASKSSTVILPVVLCLCAWWMEDRWRWRHLAKLAPVFLMSVAAAAVSMWTQRLELAAGIVSHGTRSWPERLVTAGDAVWFYLGKLLWPHPLIFIYPRWDIDAGRWFSYPPLLALPILLLILWFQRRSWARPYFFAFAYFLAALLPVLGLVDHYFLHYSFVADRFQYLAAMGPLALAGAGLARLADFAIPGRPRLQAMLAAGLLLILGLLSWRRSCIYEDEETLWTDTLARNPKCWVADNDLGSLLVQKGRVDEAILDYRKALQIKPDYAGAYGNLGFALFQKGEADEAIAQYRKALELNPRYAKARYNLGVALFQKGRMDEAIAQFRQVLAIDPHDAATHSNLGVAFAQKGQLDEAIIQFQEALEINPNMAGIRRNLDLALAQKEQRDRGR